LRPSRSAPSRTEASHRLPESCRRRREEHPSEDGLDESVERVATTRQPFYHLARIGAGAVQKLREGVPSEITTTFASHYTREITLAEALDPDVIRADQRKATGEKYLIVPSKD
jgi:hypothetical protein